MITESSYWKKPLLESALRFKEYSESNFFEEEKSVQIEKDIFIGFYSIRKLMDTVKIKDSTKEMKFQIQWSPNIKQVDYINNHFIDKLYNLKQINQETRTLKFICDQIVHSYIFMPAENEKSQLIGFFFTSDREKNKKIFYISIQDVINIFNYVGNDYPDNLHSIRNPNTGEFETKVW